MADGCQMDPDLMRASRTQAYLNVVVPVVQNGALLDVVPLDAVPLGAREITFANDFDGLPLGLAAHTDPMRGCGTRRWV